jgi:hypothetical protein
MESTLERGLAHARRSGDPRFLAQFVFALAQSATYGPSSADDASRRLAELAGEVRDNASLRATVQLLGALLDAMREDFGRARSLAADSLAVLEELGGELRLASNRQAAVAIELLAGDAVAAEREARAAHAVLSERGDRAILPTIEALLATALCDQGRLDEAAAAVAAGDAIVASRDAATRVLLHAARARALADEGAARSAVDLADGTQNPSLRGDAQAGLAEVLLAAGRVEEADAVAEGARACYAAKGNKAAAARLNDRLRARGPAGRAS